MQKTIARLLLALCGTIGALGQSAGDFSLAYSYSAASGARSAEPTASTMAGTASFGAFVSPTLLIIGSTQTFTAAKTPGTARTWSYGVTKIEFNRTWSLVPKSTQQLDYTIILPTNGPGTPGTEHYGHQFLGLFGWQHSEQNYFEVDTGDYMGGRDTKPGFKHTALLSVLGQTNGTKDGKSNWTYDYELDLSPSSEGTPASAVLTAGVERTIHSKVTLITLAQVGLTANDPMIGVSVRLKFTGNLAGKGKPETKNAVNFSKLQRIERRFGRIGRF